MIKDRNRYIEGPQGTELSAPTAESLLVSQLHAMQQQVREFGCSLPRIAPVNKVLVSAYEQIGGAQLDEIIDYDILALLPETLARCTGATAIKKYQRTFKPGQGEGIHNDNHDLVLTYTMGGTAEFTIDAQPPHNVHELGEHALILFEGRRLHAVSSPLSKGYRTITAFGVDL